MTTAVNEPSAARHPHPTWPYAAHQSGQAHPATAAGLPRLLPASQKPESLRAHLARLGPVPYRNRGNRGNQGDQGDRSDRGNRSDLSAWTRSTQHADLIADLEAAGLTGRGGAAFPVHRKLAAVAKARGHKVIVANGAESEPASHKDAVLLRLAPNLVLDGLQLAAEAIGAREAHLYLHQGANPEILRALAERSAANLDRVTVTVTKAPPRFLAGQEAALVNRLSGGPALPTFTPPRVFERGVGGAPTLVQNVETLAHIALIARYGPQWFRALGTHDEPGSMLATIYHATDRPEVVEAGIGTPLSTLVKTTGAQALLVGGFHGTWLPMPLAAQRTLDNKSLSQNGAALGAGLLAALPKDRCGLAEAARITRYLAAESAGQCGPCLNGLPRMAAALTELTRPHRPSRRTREDVERWAGLVTGRGACSHPDGTARFVKSALIVFAAEIALHERGMCSATDHRPFLPLPHRMPTTEEDWT